MREMELNINSNTFEDMKNDFNKVLNRTLTDMRCKKSDEATLTVKLNISLSELEVPDLEAASRQALRTAVKACFEHKVSSVMQIKTEKTGELGGQYELVYYGNTLGFVLKPIDGQQTLFEGERFEEDIS